MSAYTQSPQRLSARCTDPDSVRHSREDAVDDRVFERMVEATYQLEPPYDLQCRFVLFVAGRLGLRAGEIAHMTEEWIRWRESMIDIPRHEPCDSGRGGSVCAHCEANLEQSARIATRNSIREHCQSYQQLRADPAGARERGLLVEPEYSVAWVPKTESAAREVPFDANTRAALVVEEFFERYDRWPHSRQSVNRRVNKIARHTDGVAVADVYPHALRATAATKFADSGLQVFSLKAVMGWSQLSTAKAYISSSGTRTARAIRDVSF